MPDTAPGPQTGDLCGASTRGICLDDDKPPLYLGPCVLRKDHDGLIHQTADGARWMGDVGSAPTIPPRPDVPDELLDIAERAWNEFAKTAPVGLYDHDNIRRHILAAVIPAIEQRMREEAAAHADAIEAARDRWCLRAQQAEAAVQRVRDLADAADADVSGSFARRFGGEPFPAKVPTEVLRAALDAKQPTGQPALTEVVTEEATRLAATATSGVDATEVTVNLDAEQTEAAPRPDDTCQAMPDLYPTLGKESL